MEDSDIDDNLNETFITEEIISDDEIPEDNDDLSEEDSEEEVDDEEKEDDEEEDEITNDENSNEEIKKSSDFNWSHFNEEERRFLQNAKSKFEAAKDVRVKNYCPMNFVSLVGKIAEYIGRGGTLLIRVDPLLFEEDEWTNESFAFVCALCRTAPFATFISHTHERLLVSDEALITVAVMTLRKGYRYKDLNTNGLQKYFPRLLHACSLNSTQVIDFKSIVKEIEAFKKLLNPEVK